MLQSNINKPKLIQEAKLLGIDLIGVASVDRFVNAPRNHKPDDIMPTAKSVIVLAQKCLSGPINNHHWSSYTTVHDGNIGRLDNAAYRLARYLEDKYGSCAIPVPAMAPFSHWDEEQQYAAGDLSHKHAAVAAGLGVLGKNSLLITPKYGNKVNLVSIITDASIDPDPIINDKLCPSGCQLCIKSCPVGAINSGGTVNQTACRGHCWTKLPRGFSVLQCWRCREICPTNAATM